MLRLVPLKRFSRALPTSRVHPQLDRRTPSTDHFLNNTFITSDDTQLFCNPKLGGKSTVSDVHKRA